SGGGKAKWVLGGLAVVLAIALAVVVTVLVVKPDTGTPAGPLNAGGDSSASEFASANDTGPISIITEDPSCAAWIPINNTFSDSSKNGWLNRDPSIPVGAWSSEQRKQYEEVGQAMRAAADQTEALVKLTTHRVMRQLYEQFIVYARAYAEAVPSYTPRDDALARAASLASRSLSGICQAISFGSAAARAPLVSEGAAPSSAVQSGDLANPKRFLTSPDPVCPDWKAADDQFLAEVADWLKTSPDTSAAQRSPEEKALNEAAIPVMRESADRLEELGRRSDNQVLEDFAILAAQYRRAYAQAIPTYTSADKHLYDASVFTVGVVIQACNAAAG
ncbi:uncharacterized protein RMCFA_1292, partial [Mycolicibacterium fortuitum subsp. acetamidolyticum]